MPTERKVTSKPTTRKCPQCWGGRVIDSADSEAQAAIEAADNLGVRSGDQIFGDVARRYPRSVVTCPGCNGTTRIPA
jgi:hypothetical protein